MKKSILIITLLFSLNSYALTQKIEVLGMVCAFCAQGIEKNLQDIEGVSNVYINLDNYFVVIESKNTAGISNEKIRNIIIDAGYDVNKIEIISESVEDIRKKYEKK